MKFRLTKVVLALSVMLVVAGCQSKATSQPSSQTSAKQSVTKQPKKSVTKNQNNSRAQAVQKILDEYKDQTNVGVAYTDLSSGATASINGDRSFYAASVAKLPVIAFTQHEISTGKISWDTSYQYEDSANSLPNAMVSGGTGTIQNENHSGKSYVVSDLVQRAIEQSDNQASNQLFYHVAHKNESDFNQYLKTTSGINAYSKNMTATQANRTIIAVWNQDSKASDCLENTEWAHDKIGTLPVTVAHKIGINGAANNDAAIVLSDHQFALTIMTDGWSDAQIAQLAQKIYTVAK